MANSAPIDMRVALLISCPALCEGVAGQFAKLRCDVVQGAQFYDLQLELRSAPAGLLVTDQASYADALCIASEQQLPIALIAPTVLNAFGVLDDRRLSGLIIPPLSPGLFADLLSSILANGRYRPRLVHAHLLGVQLTPKEHQLLQLRFAGHTIDETADLMAIDVDTAARYERRIRERFEQIERKPPWSGSGMVALTS